MVNGMNGQWRRCWVDTEGRGMFWLGDTFQSLK
jgi:hypothetical protein